MMCWHKWEKWREYEESGRKVWKHFGRQMSDPWEYKDVRERRKCVKCGKLEDRLVRNIYG